MLTKLDGSAKGGIVVAVQRELGVPVKLVGLGEGADDLAPFDPAAFVDALLEPLSPARGPGCSQVRVLRYLELTQARKRHVPATCPERS